jgi:hypothetical protein
MSPPLISTNNFLVPTKKLEIVSHYYKRVIAATTHEYQTITREYNTILFYDAKNVVFYFYDA